MEINSNINVFYKGLDLDTDVSALKKDSIRYAQNIRLIANDEGTSAIAQNSDYIQKYNINIGEGRYIIGVVEAKQCLCDNDTCTPKECAVVFTTDDNGYNYVYTVDFDSNDVKEIINGQFNWKERLSLISNFESCDHSNVYIADGVNTLRVLNIAKTYGKITDTTMLDMIPASNGNPLRLIGLTTGQLKAGKYQYCYQFFNERGTQSVLQSVSQLIPISNTIGYDNSNEVFGQQYDTVTTRGIMLETSFINTAFDRLRIYRISYEITGQTPTIEICDEIKITKSEEEQAFTYTDFGETVISVITLDELNALSTPYDFVTQTIESKDNRLFAANIKEVTWDVEYDARAYRANSGGNVLLKSAQHDDMQFDIKNIPDIPEEHDCINPSNVEIFSEESFVYVYNAEGQFGGTGKNISYDFIFTEIPLSQDATAMNSLYNGLDINVSKSTGIVQLLDQNKNVVALPYLDKEHTIVFNYSDEWVCANYTGYQRDEIYRFGIVFYNHKHQVSPVHWIGDIRIPCSMMTNDSTSVLYPFHVGEFSQYHSTTIELLGYAVGLRFTVNNIPEEATAFEIVRCPRTDENRTIVTQAIASALLNPTYNTDGDPTWLQKNGGAGSKDLRPAALFNLGKRMDVYNNYDWEANVDRYNVIKDYCELVSPEICVSQENTLQLIRNGMLCKMYGLYSYNQGNQLSFTTSKIYHLSGELVDNASMPYGYYVSEHDALCTGSAHSGSYGASALFKYYLYTPDQNEPIRFFNIEDSISPKQVPNLVKVEFTKDFQEPIGNMAYINTTIGAYKQFGRHGKNLVVRLESDFSKSENKQYYDCTATGQAYQFMNSAGVYNIKKSSSFYNSVYADRLNSVYMSCNAYVKKQEGSHKIYCFGGDTYLGVLDYLHTAMMQEETDYDGLRNFRIHVQCYIPFETTVNMHLFSNEQFHHSEKTPILNLIQTDAGAFGGYIQKYPQYTYNTVYSQQGTARTFIPRYRYSIDDLEFNNRILSSELKSNLEINDSWMIFKVANYLDVDNKYGQITNLKNANSKLYFFQDNAVGIASVNDRSLITDDNMAELTLGTGGILARYDYVGITNGSSIVNDYSIIDSASALYWYDFDKNSICMLTNGIIELSKLKNVQSHYNNSYYNKVDRTRPVSLFNKKYNEIWFKLSDNPLIFNEQLNAFTSFYTHDFDFALQFDNRIVTIKNNKFYEHNEKLDKNKDVEPLISKLEIVVNDNFMHTKVFDNVNFYADFSDNQNNITKAWFKTKNQISKQIDANNIECREDNYRFPIPREDEQNNSMSYIGRMRGHYLHEFYVFDCNKNTFKIPYIKTTYRQSML